MSGEPTAVETTELESDPSAGASLAERFAEPAAKTRELVPVILMALVVSIGCQLIGSVTLKLGKLGSIVFYPMVFALVIGGIISSQRIKPMPLRWQKAANSFLSMAVLVLVARLSFNIGPSLTKLASVGPALLLQEVGHLLGTVVLALPVAVLLRMGPATIGATFSLDREGSFAMVDERYGSDSDQYRGVLAMYVFGTLCGAVYITLLTSWIVSMHVFDPRALAMATGVGSGSMLAASLAVIVADYPARTTELGALSALSNLITSILGVYVGIWVALPLADRFYKLLTRRSSSRTAELSPEQAAKNRALAEMQARNATPVHVPEWVTLVGLSALGIVTAVLTYPVTDRIKHTHTAIPFVKIVIAYVIMSLLIALGLYLYKVTKVSAIIWVTTIGALISAPFVPFGTTIANTVSTVDFLSAGTVVLAFAGLSVGKDIPVLAKIGWKIIPVGLVSISASFVLAAVIAEFTLGIWRA